MSSILLSNVVKRFGDNQTIHDVNLSIEEGEFVVFVGPSGCGKSTLLRMIAGLEDISDGTVSIAGNIVNDTPPSERGVAMVFQSYALYPHMTVAENMGYSLKVNKVPESERESKVKLVSKALQLEHLLDRKPAQLSGGQRQRVAIGRAIVRDPKVFLFDEPLSNLDAELRVDMRLHIAKLHQDLRSTMVYVTHDQVEAMTLADKIVVLRDGKVEQVGSPMNLYQNPKNRFVAGFIGSPKMNFIECKVEHWDELSLTVKPHVGDTLTLPIKTESLQIGTSLTIGIRPEHISTEVNIVKLNFQCEVIERLGGMTYVFGQCGGIDDFKYLQHGDTLVRPGDILPLFASPSALHLFEASGKAINFTQVDSLH
ncbi:sn-glycerol-3-phosphate ABC transporter ATP-binding protein UgpC [Vibrio sp. CDRSL-10 TSBA]